jgi:hypothetical protein
MRLDSAVFDGGFGSQRLQHGLQQCASKSSADWQVALQAGGTRRMRELEFVDED